jgi:hypothetical protein
MTQQLLLIQLLLMFGYFLSQQGSHMKFISTGHWLMDTCYFSCLLLILGNQSSDWLWAGQPRGRTSRPSSVKNVSLLHIVQTSSGTHPASYPMGTGGKVASVWSWPLTHRQLVPRSRKWGFIHPLPHTPSGHLNLDMSSIITWKVMWAEFDTNNSWVKTLVR